MKNFLCLRHPLVTRVTQHNHLSSIAIAQWNEVCLPKGRKGAHHKKEQPKSPEQSVHLRLISKGSSRGSTDASEAAQAWSLEFRVPHTKDLQKALNPGSQDLECSQPQERRTS